MTEFKRKNLIKEKLTPWLIVLGIVLLFLATCAMTMLAPYVNKGF